ncbi:PhoH family protein [Candidatus Saccharibacteria bacterium]|nr:PhoH family protein [Candidatus Saccharibacteria bacterium]
MEEELFFLDTCTLLGFRDVLPDPESEKPAPLKDPNIDLSGKHLAIPVAVIMELDKFKEERNTARGDAARLASRRLRKLFENTSTGKLFDSYYLKNPVHVQYRDQLISIVPLHKHFHRSLTFKPSKKDFDGKIIATVIAAGCAKQGIPIDGSVVLGEDFTMPSNIVLLTNDNNMATRANAVGVKTSSYKYKLPPLYTGRRDLEVPASLLENFAMGEYDCSISLEEWKKAMPDEPDLVANELIVMRNPKAMVDLETKKWGNVGRYDAATERIVHLSYLKGGPEITINNPGQAFYYDCLRNPNISIIICTGVAGTGKTFMAVLYAMWAVEKGYYLGATVVPCLTDNNYGYLPGDLSEKMEPAIRPLKTAIKNDLLMRKYAKKVKDIEKFGVSDKEANNLESQGNKKSAKGTGGKEANNFESQGNKKSAKGTGGKATNGLEFADSMSLDNTSLDGNPLSNRKSVLELAKTEADLKYKNWFGEPIPIESARGESFNKLIAIYDEFQDHNNEQADTLIKRLGVDGKIIITGDPNQVHAAYLDRGNNGITYATAWLKNLPGVAVVHLTPNEVVRHPLIAELTKRQQEAREAGRSSEA